MTRIYKLLVSFVLGDTKKTKRPRQHKYMCMRIPNVAACALLVRYKNLHIINDQYWNPKNVINIHVYNL